MHVADLQNGEAIELAWQASRADMVVAQLDIMSVSVAAAGQASDPQHRADHGVHRVPVLDVKEVTALAECLCFVLGFDPQPLAGMQAAKSTLQESLNFFYNDGAAAISHADGVAMIETCS